MSSAKSDSAIAGTIGKQRTPEEQAMHDKRTAYRKSALRGDDVLFDIERGRFLIHGKHAKLIGVEAVIAVDLPSMLMSMAVLLQTVVVPLLNSLNTRGNPAAAGDAAHAEPNTPGESDSE